MPRPRVFIDLDSRAASGRMIIELFKDEVPKSVENFRALCTGEKGLVEGVRLCYQGSRLHRIVAPEFLIQGGDIVNGDGTGGESIYGGCFEDESLGWNEMKERGLVCMANSDRDTNSSQFFITLCETPWLKDLVTVVGRVVDGMEMIDDLQNVIVDENDSPVQGEEVVITRCGQLEFKKKPKKEKLSIKGDKELEKSSEDQIPPSSRDPDPSAQRKGQIDQNDNKDPHRTGQHGKTQQPSRPRRRSASRQDVPEVILKGRGAMKYKEHHSSRRNKSPDYGRLR